MINKSRAARRQRQDTMKKKNKNYLSLTEQGIKKAWDKAVIFKDSITGQLQMVVYYQNKPFYCWPVKDDLDINDLRFSLGVMLDFYNNSTLNQRKVQKSLSRYFVSYDASERVVTYRRGGVLFPSFAGV